MVVQFAARPRGLPAAASLRRWARAALAAARRDTRRALDGSVLIRLVGARESAALNGRYRRKPCATNVLSFEGDTPPGVPAIHLGDIVICIPVVQREARAQGKPVRAHWAHMVVHGILHLSGYDHLRRRDAAVMEALERRVLSQLGFPDPYV